MATLFSVIVDTNQFLVNIDLQVNKIYYLLLILQKTTTLL